MMRAAYREAAMYHEQALVALRHLPETRETMEQRIDLHFDLRTALLALGELAPVPEVLRAADPLAEALGDQGRQGRLALYMALHFSYTGAYDHRLAASECALALANELGMRPLQAHCHCGLGTLSAKAGQWERACTKLVTAIELYRALDMTFWLPQMEAALAQVEGR
jgi:hypothetical protein